MFYPLKPAISACCSRSSNIFVHQLLIQLLYRKSMQCSTSQKDTASGETRVPPPSRGKKRSSDRTQCTTPNQSAYFDRVTCARLLLSFCWTARDCRDELRDSIFAYQRRPFLSFLIRYSYARESRFGTKHPFISLGE